MDFRCPSDLRGIHDRIRSRFGFFRLATPLLLHPFPPLPRRATLILTPLHPLTPHPSPRCRTTPDLLSRRRRAPDVSSAETR